MNSDSRPDVAELPPGWTDAACGVVIIERVSLTQQSVVYKAEQQFLERTVAVKFSRLPPDDNSRFRQEASVLEELIHPNIGKVFSYGIVLEHAYMLMEWLEGETLAQLLTRERPDLRELRATFAQVFDALEFAHSRGIVHRDIKPSNIYITSTGTEYSAKLIDFGLAKQIEKSVELTRTGEIAGSPAYMSPEQCNNLPVDVRSDIYSFGCVLYECAQGQPPFAGSSAFDLMYKHVNETPREIDGNKALSKVILRCLEKDPDKRYQNIRNLQNDLSHTLEIDEPKRRLMPVGRVVLAGMLLVAAAAFLAVSPYRSDLPETALTTKTAVESLAMIDQLKSEEKFLEGMKECQRLEASTAKSWSPKDRIELLFRHATLMYRMESNSQEAYVGDELLKLRKRPSLASETHQGNILVYAGIAYMRSNRLNDAARCLEEDIALKSRLNVKNKLRDLVWYHLLLGEVRHKQHDFPEEEKVLRLADQYAIQNNELDKSRTVKVRLAECMLKQGRARETLDLIGSLEPDAIEPYAAHYASLKKLAERVSGDKTRSGSLK